MQNYNQRLNFHQNSQYKYSVFFIELKVFVHLTHLKLLRLVRTFDKNTPIRNTFKAFFL
jgi:hypothetical protein